MRIHRKDLEARATKAPAGYFEVVMDLRDPSKDTEDTIYLSSEGYGAVKRWVKNPQAIVHKPPATPKTNHTISAPSLPAIPDGAGTELKKVLHKIGIRPSASCACNERAAKMDRMGTHWCDENFEGIVDWLEEEAKNKKLPFIRAAGRVLARHAIRTAKKKKAPRYAFCMSMSNIGAKGMGDAVCGMYAACGLAEATGEKVIYYAHDLPWIDRVSHPGVVLLPYRGIDTVAGVDYHDQIANAFSRKQFYCNDLASYFKIDKFKPACPHEVNIRTSKIWGEGHTVLAPYANYMSRSWDKWRALATALVTKGHRVIAIGSGPQGDNLAKLFDGLSVSWVWGQPPAQIASMLVDARLVIGNDSGITHLGGLLRRPTISIHAGSLPHEFLYDCAPTIKSVVSPNKIPRSDANMAELRKITVEQVLRVIT